MSRVTSLGLLGLLLGSTRCAWCYGRARIPARNLKVQMEYFLHLFHSVSADRDEEYFTLEEIKQKVEDQKRGWKTKFKGGLEKIEVEHIEESLESRAAKEEVRYDFTFYTPTCRYVRVKVSLLLIPTYLLSEEI